MKKCLIAWVVLLGCTFSFSSCEEKLKEKEGVVTSVDASKLGDTFYSMKVYDGTDTLLFSLKDARYSNGVAIKDDQVRVNYINGNGDTLRAMLVYVQPKPSQAIEIKPDSSKELLSR